MNAAEFESRVQLLEQVLVDHEGNLRPIERIDFEVLGGQVRWSVWSAGQRLQSLTTRIDDVAGLLEASKLILQMAVADQASAGNAENGEDRSSEEKDS